MIIPEIWKKNVPNHQPEHIETLYSEISYSQVWKNRQLQDLQSLPLLKPLLSDSSAVRNMAIIWVHHQHITKHVRCHFLPLKQVKYA